MGETKATLTIPPAKDIVLISKKLNSFLRKIIKSVEDSFKKQYPKAAKKHFLTIDFGLRRVLLTGEKSSIKLSDINFSDFTTKAKETTPQDFLRMIISSNFISKIKEFGIKVSISYSDRKKELTINLDI